MKLFEFIIIGRKWNIEIALRKRQVLKWNNLKPVDPGQKSKNLLVYLQKLNMLDITGNQSLTQRIPGKLAVAFRGENVNI